MFVLNADGNLHRPNPSYIRPYMGGYHEGILAHSRGGLVLAGW